MALNQQALQSLNSPRLQTLNLRTLAGMSVGQLRSYLAAERYELGQLQTEILRETSGDSSGEGSNTPRAAKGLSERQQLMREILSVRQQKIAAAAQLQAIRQQKVNAVKASDLKKIDKNIKKEKKRKAKIAKQEAKKDKYWQKGIRKGVTTGEKAQNRFKRFFDSKKWSDADKDRMRMLMDQVGVYEGDELFKLLTLMASGAFDSLEQAEEFLNEYMNTEKGTETQIQKLSEDTRWSYEQAREGMEALRNEGFGIGAMMTF